jgi:hypothetical protein
MKTAQQHHGQLRTQMDGRAALTPPPAGSEGSVHVVPGKHSTSTRSLSCYPTGLTLKTALSVVRGLRDGQVVGTISADEGELSGQIK